MNISPVGINTHVQAFKGTQVENTEEPKQNSENNQVIVDAIERNTAAIIDLKNELSYRLMCIG